MDIIRIASNGRATLASDTEIPDVGDGTSGEYVVIDKTTEYSSVFYDIMVEDGIKVLILIPKHHFNEPSKHFAMIGVDVPHYLGHAYLVRQNADGELVGFDRVQRRRFTTAALRLRNDPYHTHILTPYVNDLEVSFTGAVIADDVLQCQCGKSARWARLLDDPWGMSSGSVIMMHGEHGTMAHQESDGVWRARGIEVDLDTILASNPVPVRVVLNEEW